MIASISFDYFSILKNAKKVSKRNPLSSKNIKYLKKFPFICFGTGLIVAVFVWLCTLVGIVSGSCHFGFSTSFFFQFSLSF